MVALSGRNALNAKELIQLPGNVNEVVVRTSGLHAEIKVLDRAGSLGLSPRALRVSRPFCSSCSGEIIGKRRADNYAIVYSISWWRIALPSRIGKLR